MHTCVFGLYSACKFIEGGLNGITGSSYVETNLLKCDKVMSETGQVLK